MLGESTIPPNGDPVLSIIIVSWNTQDLLRKCLSSILDIIGTPQFEVIVVDNGSSDGSAAMVSAEFPQVILVTNDENLGFAKATNQGGKISRGQYFLLLNSDTEASPLSINTCIEYMNSHSDVAIVGCRLEYPSGEAQNSCFRFPSIRGIIFESIGLSKLFPQSALFNCNRYGEAQWSETREVDCVMGSFMMLRSSALETAEVFDDGYFMYAEEVDLCWRMTKGNWKVLYFPKVSIIHHWGGSSGVNPAVAAWAYEGVRRGTLRFISWNRSFPRAYLTNGIYLLTSIPRVPYWLMKDILTFAYTRRFAWNMALKIRVLGFHLRVLLNPKTMLEPWKGPE